MTPQDLIARIDKDIAEEKRKTERLVRNSRRFNIGTNVFFLTVWPTFFAFIQPALFHVHRSLWTNCLHYIWCVVSYFGTLELLKRLKKYKFVVVELQAHTNPGMFSVIQIEQPLVGSELVNIPLHPIEHIEEKMGEFGAKLHKIGYYSATKKQAVLIRLNLQ